MVLLHYCILNYCHIHFSMYGAIKDTLSFSLPPPLPLSLSPSSLPPPSPPLSELTVTLEALSVEAIEEGATVTAEGEPLVVVNFEPVRHVYAEPRLSGQLVLRERESQREGRERGREAEGGRERERQREGGRGVRLNVCVYVCLWLMCVQ